ncbi:MepB family protein [Paenibacillus hunanensis]|uniref:MepB family protein n=1 Tax=Paenibacillus hunanensis TaxID=539262 RepID=UPI0020272094|nr:MepB family protein [Paenibacillus hunanensis]MCL9659485.1 MepB family protein [Paenibacillus hunanensis]
MYSFNQVLNDISERCYEPNQLAIQHVQEEVQNAEYGAGVFVLDSISVRFRVAKITPNKIGQFVVFWEKDMNNKNQAFSYKKATDVLVINTFADDHKVGQFVFPKEVLLQKNILRTASTNGKMAIRVYPAWDQPVSKQALATQKWQLEYFVDLTDWSHVSVEKLLKLYFH